MLDRLKSLIHEFNAKRELQKHSPLLNRDAHGLGAEGLVELLYGERWERFFWTKQVKRELVDLAKRVEALKPQVVVEIGTNTGGTLFIFTKVAAYGSRVVSIDLPGGEGGGGYPDYKSDFFKSFCRQNQQLFFIKGNSQQSQTVEKLQAILKRDFIDFLFIDGDHSFDGVKRDFELYSPLVRRGGLVAFHDIKKYPDDHWIQVDKFWNAIKNKYQYEEYVDDSVHWGGIGILVM